MSKLEDAENKIKLYLALVDQVQKYSTTFWQFPTALLAANLFSFDKFSGNPSVLIGTAVLNGVLIFAYYKLVCTQRAIINATKTAESVLHVSYEGFIPTFQTSKVRSPILVASTLMVLDGVLLIYALLPLFCKRGV